MRAVHNDNAPARAGAREPGPRSLQQIFAVPALLAAITCVGLIAALIGDGLWDLLSWLSLGAALAVAAWFGLPRRTHHGT